MTLDLFTPLFADQCSTFTSSNNTQQNPLTELPAKGIVISSAGGNFGLQVRQSMNRLTTSSSSHIADLGLFSTDLRLWDGAQLHIHIADVPDCKLSSMWTDGLVIAASNHIRNYGLNAVVPIAHQRQIKNESQLTDEWQAIANQYRLGSIRSNPQSVEPLLRGADGLLFDLSAVRASDAPGVANSTSSGLYAEEACQIIRYAGESTQLKSIVIKTDITKMDSEIAATLVAHMIWYAVEGYSLRLNSLPADGNKDYKEYVTETLSGTLHFYLHDHSGKWWLRSVTDKTRFIPCSYDEYSKAVEGQLSDRLLYFL